MQSLVIPFFAGKTVVVIAHRLTTTKNCDNILVLEHGHVAEEARGDGVTSAHEQLIADDATAFPRGMYKGLWAPYASMDL